MKTKLSILILLLFSTGLKAQMTSVGSTWHYDLQIPGTDSIAPLKITAAFDTVIAAKNVTALSNLAQWLPRENGITLPDYVYVAHTNGQYEIYDFNRSEFQLLIDSNWQVGDTFVFQWGNTLDSMIVSQANIPSGITNISKHLLQRISNGTVSGGISAYLPGGYDKGFIPRFTNGFSDSINSIRCYSNPHGFSFDHSAYGCEATWVINSVQNQKKMSLVNFYPNPSSNGTFKYQGITSLENLVMEVYDTKGQIQSTLQLHPESGEFILPQNQLFLVLIRDQSGNTSSYRLSTF
ncbi:MAG: hypothetical protein EP332_02250 [Bacteroidetes bacterium]|nr:MAG: hypothetical protein EP332_02250 [Bacteroidota bacterium]